MHNPDGGRATVLRYAVTSPTSPRSPLPSALPQPPPLPRAARAGWVESSAHATPAGGSRQPTTVRPAGRPARPAPPGRAAPMYTTCANVCWRSLPGRTQGFSTCAALRCGAPKLLANSPFAPPRPSMTLLRLLPAAHCGAGQAVLDSPATQHSQHPRPSRGQAAKAAGAAQADEGAAHQKRLHVSFTAAKL